MSERFEVNPYGFAWGAMEITRLASHEGRVWFSLKTDSGRDLEVYVSRTGKSVRFFEGDQECVLTSKVTDES